MLLTVQEMKAWLIQVDELIQSKKAYLTELDQAIGDGDHGLNLARGFKEVTKKIETSEYIDIGQLFKDTGMVLLSKVGGASGPLYGSAFIKAAVALQGKQSVSIPELTMALEDGLQAIKMRGKAHLTDKTMIDVWEPVLSFLKESGEEVNWDAADDLAKEKMEATKEIEAKKGRAAYLGKRSIGHIDPGSASSYYLFSSLFQTAKGGKE
jgi:phosphoenolpyruvate---glycerone phosphotransferase subunit DhaL